MNATDGKLSRTQLAAYWEGLSKRHLSRSADGLEVICFAGMPAWFNGFMHRYQMLAFQRLVNGEVFADCDVLDLGTGVGRWASWFARWPNARVTGIDIEPDRLARASAMYDSVRFERMPVDSLRFADASFDVINCVTVLQHVDDDTKRRALDEAQRVLRPGGRMILFEVTDMGDDAPHVFPWAGSRWLHELQARGLVVERKVGDQYIPLLRLAKATLRRLRGAQTRGEIDALKAGRRTVTDVLQMQVLRVAVLASYPLEELCRFLPSRYARITGFSVRKAPVAATDV